MINYFHISSSFKCPKTLGKKTFNYISFSKNSFSACYTYACHCNDLNYKPFIDNDDGLIITGNLKIINNPHLQKLMKFGTKFRLPSHNKVTSVVKQLTYNFDFFIHKVALHSISLLHIYCIFISVEMFSYK